MKKILLCLIPVLGFSQKEMPIKFVSNLRDNTSSVAKFYFKDIRKDKKLPIITFKEEQYQMILDERFGNEILARFKKDNPESQEERELVLLLEDYTVFEAKSGNKTVADGRIKAAVFEKKDNLYYLIGSMDKLIANPQVQSVKTPKNMSYFLSDDISTFVKYGFRNRDNNGIGISEEDLLRYRTVIISRLPVFVSGLKDGVYTSGREFFSVQPLEGYSLVKNEEGKVESATKVGSKKVNASKIYAYVENGKVYKNTYSGFMPMEKDDRGFYVVSNRGELEYIAGDSTYGMFGLIGGIAGAIDQNITQNKAKKEEKKPVYIDPFNYGFVYD